MWDQSLIGKCASGYQGVPRVVCDPKRLEILSGPVSFGLIPGGVTESSNGVKHKGRLTARGVPNV